MLDFTGAEGQNRTADTGIFSPIFCKSKNVIITSSWFYSTFSTNFWFRLEPFGNIWPWRAQFGHSRLSRWPSPTPTPPDSYFDNHCWSLLHNYPLPYLHKSVICLKMDDVDDTDDEIVLKGKVLDLEFKSIVRQLVDLFSAMYSSIWQPLNLCDTRILSPYIWITVELQRMTNCHRQEID